MNAWYWLALAVLVLGLSAAGGVVCRPATVDDCGPLTLAVCICVVTLVAAGAAAAVGLVR